MSSELVIKLDRAIVADPDAERCPNNEDHGKLWPHGSGAALVCGKCGYNQAVSSGVLDE